MVKYSYAYYKLAEAIEILVVSTKSKKEQIILVANILAVLKDKDFPPEALPHWQYYSNSISNKDAPKGYDSENKQGRFYWTAQQMHWKTMQKIRSAVWGMFYEIIATRNF